MRTIWLSIVALVCAFVVMTSQTQAVADGPEPRYPLMPDDPNGIIVNVSITATKTNPPTIYGTTNLPDGTALSVALTGDPPACLPQCGIGDELATVEKGHFTIQGARLTRGVDGQVGRYGTMLVPDSYNIDVIVAVGSVEPPSVKSIIGDYGQHLRGPHVVALGPKGFVPVTFPWSPTKDVGILGLTVFYRQKILLLPDAEVIALCAPSEGNEGHFMAAGHLYAECPPSTN